MTIARSRTFRSGDSEAHVSCPEMSRSVRGGTGDRSFGRRDDDLPGGNVHTCDDQTPSLPAGAADGRAPGRREIARARRQARPIGQASPSQRKENDHVHRHRPLPPRPHRAARARLPRLPRCRRHGPSGCRRTASPATSTTMDARVGGSYRMSFTNFSSGKSHAFGGTYLELVPHERLRYTRQVRRSQPARRDADHDHS